MSSIRVETVIEVDGELYVKHLPCRKGDRVQGTLTVLNSAKDETVREQALQRLLARATASRFCSVGPYPTRDELHERS